MAYVERAVPGSLCWAELGTNNQRGAKAFYAKLLGWQFEDYPIGADSFYTMFRAGGRNAAAAYTIQTHHGPLPPHWLLYIAVSDADTATGLARGHGASVRDGPFDVMEEGRISILSDPGGAVFALWQSKRHHGIGIEGVPGAVCGAELSTRDTERCRRFYRAVFGWEFAGSRIRNGEREIAGLAALDEGRSRWLPYFGVDDVDAAVAQCAALGGRELAGTGSGERGSRVAVLGDPQGAAFGVVEVSEKS